MFKKALVYGLLLAILGPPIWTILFHMGWGKHFHKHHPGKCSIVKRSGTGSEDFQILSSGMTFVTSGLIMEMSSPNFKHYVTSRCKGSIQLVDMNNPAAGAKDIPIKHDKDFNRETFRPHGLSVLEDKVKGEHLLYVINHVMGQPDRVEKFRFLPKSGELRHEKTIFSEAFKMLNDLTMVEEDKFYITNWLRFPSDKTLVLEHFYHLPLGGIVFYNGTGGTVVKDRMLAPNGNVLSKNKRFLYVMLPFYHKLQVYKRNTDYDIELVQEVDIHTGLDNLHFSETEDALYGGCHPISYKTLAAMSYPEEYSSPSQVLRIPLKDGVIVEGDITEEFYDHGNLVSGSSVAGVYRNKMLIGSIADTLVYCDLPTPTPTKG